MLLEPEHCEKREGSLYRRYILHRLLSVDDLF